VEVLDLLPVFLKARGKDADETQLLYQAAGHALD